MARGRRLGRKVATSLAVGSLAVANLAGNRWVTPAARVPLNLTVAGGLLAVARLAGHDVAALGMAREDLKKGWRFGRISALGVAAAYTALVANRRTRYWIHDERIAGLPARAVVWRLLVSIPLGTVLVEEVAFRGVLPVLLHSPGRPRWLARAIASALFGLWHLLPSHDQMRANGGRHGLIGATAVATTLAGGLLHEIHHRSGHLVAPMSLHFATNALGLIAVRALGRR